MKAEAANPRTPLDLRRWLDREGLDADLASGAAVKAEEYALLEAACREAANHVGPIVEIGTLFGQTTVMLARWKASGQHLITVDNYSWNPYLLPHDSHLRLTRAIIEDTLGPGITEIIDVDKNEFYASYSGPTPAMVFLDAIHGYEETKKDIEWAFALNVPIICGHDYSPAWPGVCEAVDQYEGPDKLQGTLWRLGRRSVASRRSPLPREGHPRGVAPVPAADH